MESAAVREALRAILDPEVGISVVDQELVYRAEALEGRIRVELTMTFPACPVGRMLRTEAEEELRGGPSHRAPSEGAHIMKIVEAWTNDLRQVLGGESLRVADLRIGVFYTAARLSSGHAAVAFTPRGLADTVCCPRSAASAPPAGRLAGADAWEIARYALSDAPLRRAAGVAVLNALSARAMEKQPPDGVQVLPGMDALDAAGAGPEDAVAMVGGFTPFIKRLKGQVRELWIVDKHPEALKPDEAAFWRPPDQAAETLARASVVVITGSALVEGGLDELLTASSGAQRVVLAGPTASPWPPTFFARGVHVLGGIRVRDGEKILRVVGEGGSGYFFEEGAEKICMMPENTPAGRRT